MGELAQAGSPFLIGGNMEDTLSKLYEMADEGLSPETEGVILGSLMVNAVWDEFIRTMAA